jgi:hypothetical protein
MVAAVAVVADLQEVALAPAVLAVADGEWAVCLARPAQAANTR